MGLYLYRLEARSQKGLILRKKGASHVYIVAVDLDLIS
jgi:hypothetical protein